MSVTVVVVNWNSKGLLVDCLHNLLGQTRRPEKILVMDNGSSDGAAERVHQVPGITVRQLGANLGFSAANNRALQECDTEFVALLNPDAFPEPDWLENLLKAAQAHPEVVAFGSKQVMAAAPARLDGVGDVYHFSGLVWRNGYGVTLRPEYEREKEIFSACAGAALYRREAVVDVGGFDEDYFCYVEDVDLGFRLRLAGYIAMYIPGAVVRHVGSASTGGQHSDFAVYHGHRNLVWTFVKDMPGVLFWLMLPLHVLLNFASVVWFTAHGQGGVVFRSKMDAIKGLPKMWVKRRHVQAERKVAVREIWRVLDKRLLPRRLIH